MLDVNHAGGVRHTHTHAVACNEVVVLPLGSLLLSRLLLLWNFRLHFFDVLYFSKKKKKNKKQNRVHLEKVNHHSLYRYTPLDVKVTGWLDMKE